MKNPVRIILADAQFLARAGFRHLFANDERIEIVGEATNPEQLQRLVASLAPEIVIFDYHDSEKFSIDDICSVGEQSPGTRFLIVTADGSKGNIFKALECGVNSILTKNCSREEIINAVHATARQEKFFCNKVLDIILEKHLGGEEEKEPDCLPSSLTTREIEIVGLIASGVPTREIADRLCLSTHTVYTHRKNIMKKLKINSVSEMVLYAVNAGIVKPESNA